MSKLRAVNCSMCGKILQREKKQLNYFCNYLCQGQFRRSKSINSINLLEIKGEAQQQEHFPHHWMIDPPYGPLSKGTCSCGAEKMFKNSFSEGSLFSRKLKDNRLVKAS